MLHVSVAGINMECFNMSQLPHFDTGGTVHLITNNLVGFTTPYYFGRSSRHVSDLGQYLFSSDDSAKINAAINS